MMLKTDSSPKKKILFVTGTRADFGKLKGLMESAGFSNCNFDNLTNGIVAIHSGKKGMIDA